MTGKEKYIQQQRRAIESNIDKLTIGDDEEIYLEVLKETALHLWLKYINAKRRNTPLPNVGDNK